TSSVSLVVFQLVMEEDDLDPDEGLAYPWLPGSSSVLLGKFVGIIRTGCMG
ncbi:hypothetical protein FRC18_008709, partial [Serendipita sp. 400]